MAGPTIHDYRMRFHRAGGIDLTFEIAHEDNTSAETQYYGYVSSFGSWIIQKCTVIASTRQYTYAAGQARSDYDDHWSAVTGQFVAGDPALEFTTFDQLGDDL